jgi:hypothetical protein
MCYRIYVDESINAKDGYIVAAIIAAPVSIDDSVVKVLISAGLSPRIDEYKSSNIKNNNSADRQLRSELQEIILEKDCRIAIVVCDINEREKIGEFVLKLIIDLSTKERFGNNFITINFDEGILSSKVKANFEKLLSPAKITINDNCNSKEVYGLQLADMVAHMIATILRCDLGSLKKLVPVGDNSGAETDLLVALEFELWANLRYQLAFSEGRAINESDKDDFGALLEPFGLYISDRCRVKELAVMRFGTVYLGCIH